VKEGKIMSGRAEALELFSFSALHLLNKKPKDCDNKWQKKRQIYK
jgi:hypothetical protein